MSKEKDKEQIFPAYVAKIISSTRIVINRGTSHGIKIGQAFQLFEMTGEVIIDPVTNKPLGELEIPKGTGKVIHTQAELSIVESDRIETVESSPIEAYAIGTYRQSRKIRLSFDNPKIGDLAKPI